jgi:hypothetical protein
VNEYLEGELASASDETSALTEPSATSGPDYTQRSWRTATTEYRPMPMTSVGKGGLRYAGVVAFVGELSVDRPTGGAALVAVLSEHLLASGDTRGIAA